jgi:integrase
MFLSKRGGIYYLWYVDERGKRQKVSTKATTKTEAVEFLRKFDEKEHVRQRSVKHITLNNFSALFLTYSASIHTPKTVEANRTALNEFMRFLGSTIVMQTITPSDCERFLAAKIIEASAWTARKYYLALGAAFERAKAWGHVTANPWRSVPKPKTLETLPTYFTREQFKALLAVIEDRNYRELVMVAALTGLRRGELLAMRYNWLDFSRNVLTVTNSETFRTKTGKVRVVPMCPEVLTILLSRRERMNSDCGFVFNWQGRPLSQDRVSRKLKSAIKKAGLPLLFIGTR